MLKHKEDSIQEINRKKGEIAELTEKTNLALDCVAELGELIAPLVDAAPQGGDE